MQIVKPAIPFWHKPWHGKNTVSYVGNTYIVVVKGEVCCWVVDGLGEDCGCHDNQVAREGFLQ